MYMMEYAFDSEDEIRSFFQESSTDKDEFRTYIIDRIINVLSTPRGRKAYIQYGSDFIDANSDMLAKPYPTKSVTYPRKYVDELFELFGYDKKEFKDKLKELLKSVSDNTSWNALMNSQTNVFHTIALFYSDMIYDRKLRDSARQQIGLTSYGHAFRKYFPLGTADEKIMETAYSKMNLTWELKKRETVVGWIDHTVEVAYGSYKSKLSLDMSISTLAAFNNRMWTSFNQNMKYLKQLFESVKDEVTVTTDVKGDEVYLTDTGYAKIRDNITRLITSGDSFYTNRNSDLYRYIARLKNVKGEDVYKFAQKVNKAEIKRIIDLILYVFLVKENHTIDEINSSAYINRITNIPTAVDRAIPGDPVIKPLCEKYKEKDSIVKAYICLLATYIMLRLNDVRPE